MPELPEVQVVVNYLNRHILHKQIIDIKINLSKLLKNINTQQFKQKLINNSFINIERRGKYLIFYLSDHSVMIAHLRMEGKFNYEQQYMQQKHDHLIFYFQDKSVLKYNDSRQFGTFHWYQNIDEAHKHDSIKKLGIEPLTDELDYKHLYPLIKKSNKKLKTFLLDQTKIAGIGNIYANEICFAIGINPQTITNRLNKKQIEALIKATKNILSDSIKHNGTTIHTFTFSKWDIGSYQDKLQIHGKKVCCKCHQKLLITKVNGRGTYICSCCQKLLP